MADTLPFGIDQSVWQHDSPLLIGIDDSNKLAFLNGSNLEAAITTSEIQLATGRRSKIELARPLVDGGTTGTVVPSISLGTRIRLRDAVSYQGPVSMNVWGTTPFNQDARYVRCQITIPAASTWIHCIGVELNFADSTER